MLIPESIRLFLRTIYPRKPMEILLEITNKCNLRCKMCWLWGEHGVGDRYSGLELNRNEIFELIDELSNFKPTLTITGGEPFVRSDLIDILRYIKSNRMKVRILTNGTLLDDKKIQELCEIKVDEVVFSIDGPESIHDSIRGRGTFRKVSENIRKLAKYRMESNKPKITTNTTITKLLVGRLKETVDAIRIYTSDVVDTYRFQHLWYITRKELLVSKRVVNKLLKVSAPYMESHLIPTLQVPNPKKIIKEISYVSSIPKVQIFPNLDKLELINFYTENVKTNRRCKSPFYFGVVVKPNGDVVFCPDEWITYILGNIRESNLISIWSSRCARKFRLILLRYGSFPMCKRCCWMYSV